MNTKDHTYLQAVGHCRQVILILSHPVLALPRCNKETFWKRHSAVALTQHASVWVLPSEQK